ncbi:hypothetical protein NL676_009113 [Syzygium grande]|nr:hypothetical protein NL676_009113 [Syzygium grande]
MHRHIHLLSIRFRETLEEEDQRRKKPEKMGYVVIVSLPMLILFIVLWFACHHIGKRRGQEEGRVLAAQELTAANGISMPPPASGYPPPLPPVGYPPPPPPQYFPSPSPHNPNPSYTKQEHATSY